MSLLGRALFLSVVVHVVLAGTLTLVSGGSEVPRQASDITLVLLADPSIAPKVEPPELFVPVLIEPVSIPTPVSGPGPGVVGVPSPIVAPVAPVAPKPTWLPTEPTGRSVVYLLDRSLSMSLSGTLQPARRELRSALESLPESCRFQVIAYSRLAEPLVLQGRQDLVPATPSLVRDALHRVESLLAEGGTESLRAIKRALQLRPDVVYLMTDSFSLPDGSADELTRLNTGRAAIHILELTRSQQAIESATAVRLTERNRGIYRRIVLP